MRRLLIGTVTAVAVLSADCSSRSGDDGDAAGASTPPTTGASTPARADSGTLKDVCGTGTARPTGIQGVTDDDIRVGVLSDVGFSRNPEFLDTAKASTSWCNEADGINGRKLVPVTRDTRLPETSPAGAGGPPGGLCPRRRRGRAGQPGRQGPAAMPAARLPRPVEPERRPRHPTARRPGRGRPVTLADVGASMSDLTPDPT